MKEAIFWVTFSLTEIIMFGEHVMINDKLLPAIGGAWIERAMAFEGRGLVDVALLSAPGVACS